VRRPVLLFASLLALALPAAALASRGTPGDGTLVVKNGTAPKGQAVVQLVVTGSAIGWVRGLGKILIDTVSSGTVPEVTNVDGCKNLGAEDTRQIYGNARVCTGSDFRFRAVGDTFAITIYGAQVNLVTIGVGKAYLAGTLGDLTDDGSYSVNGEPFHSLPGIPSKVSFGTQTG
jgi:hypothetical protein